MIKRIKTPNKTASVKATSIGVRPEVSNFDFVVTAANEIVLEAVFDELHSYSSFDFSNTFLSHTNLIVGRNDSRRSKLSSYLRHNHP